MRLGYDEATHALFIRFSGKPSYESEEVSPGIVVDFDRKGRPVAIEMEDVRGIADPSKLKAFSAKSVGKGDDLRTYREALGMTQYELAQALQLPRNTIARWERDELKIEHPEMLRLALEALSINSKVLERVLTLNASELSDQDLEKIISGKPQKSRREEVRKTEKGRGSRSKVS